MGSSEMVLAVVVVACMRVKHMSGQGLSAR